MIKNTFYAVITSYCIITSVAVAEPSTPSPLTLTSAQMDTITAGDVQSHSNQYSSSTLPASQPSLVVVSVPFYKELNPSTALQSAVNNTSLSETILEINRSGF